MRHSVGPGQVSTARKDAQEHGGSYPDRVSCYDSAHESHLHINDAPVLDPLYRILNYRKVNEVLVVGMECITLPKRCPYCKSPKLTKWGGRHQNICDIPRHGHPVRLQIETKRFRCREETCSKTFSQDLPSIAEGRAMTKRLMRWIGEQGLNRTFVSIAKEIRVDEKTVRESFADQQRGINQKVRLKAGQCMAIVRVKAFHGERYAVLNPALGILTDWIESTGKKDLTRRLKALSESDSVKRVGVGFDLEVISCVKEAFPNATPFIDPLAVHASLETGIRRALAALREQMTPYERRKLARAVKVLGAAKERLGGPPGAAAEVLAQQPALEEAYGFQWTVMSMFNSPSGACRCSLRAAEAIDKAIDDLSVEAAHWHGDFLEQWKSWRQMILNALERGEGMGFVWGQTDEPELGKLIEAQGRGQAMGAVRAKLLFPPSAPAFSISTPGISLQRMRAQLQARP